MRLKNLITDVAGGLKVGHADDAALASGVTVILSHAPMRAAAIVLGGGPGTREIDAIALTSSVGAADAVALSGGSAFGLEAASGVQSFLREAGRGFAVGEARVPVVPQAILFDLLNGGDKNWGRNAPYRELGYRAAASVAEDFALGAVGAGAGATVAAFGGRRLRGGVGSASEAVTGLALKEDEPVVVGALAAVNAVGAVTIGDTKHFWAAGFEQGAEFGGLGWPQPWPQTALEPAFKRLQPAASTTLCVIATDAALSQQSCHRLAAMAAAGMARAIVPVFSPFDGDIVFSLSTAVKPVKDERLAAGLIGFAAANCLARAIARAVFEAKGTLPDGVPCYHDYFSGP